MKRKIVKQGMATMTVSLPSKWIKKNNLASGDEIELSEQDTNLVITAQKKEITKAFTLDASTKKALTNRTILQAYVMGYDEITINYKDPLVLTRIKKVVDELVGFEIINESNKSCTIKELTGIHELEFDSIFRRLFRILAGICEESVQAIETRDKAAIENMISRDLDVNKFSNLCMRYLNKLGHPIPERTGVYIIICNTLEKIGDQYKEIFMWAKDSKKITAEQIRLIKKLNELFLKCYEYTFELKDEQMQEIAALYESLKKEANNASEETTVFFQIKILQSYIIMLLGLQAPFSK